MTGMRQRDKTQNCYWKCYYIHLKKLKKIIDCTTSMIFYLHIFSMTLLFYSINDASILIAFLNVSLNITLNYQMV